MSMSLTLVIVIVAIGIAWLVVSSTLRSDIERLDKLAKWSAKYAGTMRDLLKIDAELPKSIINVLDFWNSAVADRRFPSRFAYVLMMMRKELMNGVDFNKKDDDDARIFMQKHPEFEDKYMSAVVFAMMTISYSSWFWGPAIRSTIADIYAEHERRRMDRFTKAVQTKVKLSPAPQTSALCAVSH